MGNYDNTIRAELIRRRNQQYVASGVSPKDYATYLPADEEQLFRDWVAQNNVPYDFANEGIQDYDMRGYWQGMRAGDPRAFTGINPNDQQLHFTDYWKTPYHKTFSEESRFAGPNAPHWEGSQLVAPDGTVLYDEAEQ